MHGSAAAPDMKRQLMAAALFMLLACPVAGRAAGPEQDFHIEAPIDPSDYGSLQRGAGMFVNYCLGCHSMRLMRYSRVAADLGIDEDIAVQHLTFGEKLFRPIISPLSAEHAAFFDGAEPPDLSLIARAGSADWLYMFLRGFYRDPQRPSGWNNVVYTNVSMPNALQSLQGTYRKGADGSLELADPGRMDAGTFDVAVADLVNFMVYASEPSRAERLRFGYAAMILLLLLLPLSYAVYREYWRDIN